MGFQDWMGVAAAAERTGGLPVVPATVDGAIFDPWRMDDYSVFDDARNVHPPECNFWNGTVQYESPLCSHFSLSRVAPGAAERALDRATRCAVHHETECILSPEIGLSIPAAFVYEEATTSMRMLIAPRLLPHDGEETSLVVQDPQEHAANVARVYNRTIHVEYLPGGRRAPVTELLSNDTSWCVQLLREAFVAECWDNLD